MKHNYLTFDFMKKTLLMGAFLLAGLAANAQLADGSTAPDFTVTDINGVEHHLQDYLDAGKTVIMDISATWCGPCWNYHNSLALDNIYEGYGPGGSDEVVVLFVEGDSSTSVSSLYGVNTSSDTSVTQGDWTLNTPYPIIDSGSIAQAYHLTYFPTVYLICPNGKTKLVDQKTAPQLKALVGSGCAQVLEGIDSHAKLTTAETRVCEVNGSVKASLTNYGTPALTAATLLLKNGETVVSTKEFTGSIAQFATETVNFDAIDLDPEVQYTVEVSTINGAAPFNPEMTVGVTDVIIANESNNNLRIDVHTDNYPKEISWKLKDSEGTVVASGGPYVGNTNGGGADALTVKTTWANLESGTMDCYYLEMKDSYGDGWGLTNLDFAGIKIYSTQGEVFSQSATDSFKTKIVDSVVKTTGVLSTPELQATQFAVFPNPSNGIFNFTTNEAVDVTVTDLTGKTVFTAKGIDNGASINLSNLAQGMYIAKIKGATAERTEKLVIK
jgi:hypothetical protein